MLKKKVVIGLSGGVDSSVAAALLIEQGYEVEAVYLECYNEPGCRTDQDKADALKVALKLGIPFQVLDFRKEYREKVIEYFYDEYSVGRTPNPDIVCNREIKFGIFYDWSMERGYDFVATGHYARITEVSEYPGIQVSQLKRARDESKDQSYFLSQIPSDHLKRIIFPLGEMMKSEVRAEAQKRGLSTANKPDSMGICFIGEVNVHKLLKDKLGEKPGKVMYRGEIVGDHKGLWFHTIGERGGFEINKQLLKKMGMHPEKMAPLYVIGKNKEQNMLEVGERELTLKTDFFIDQTIQYDESRQLFVRIRNLGELIPVESLSSPSSSSSLMFVKTVEPVFAAAEGQSAVFYDSEAVLVGSAIIV